MGKRGRKNQESVDDGPVDVPMVSRREKKKKRKRNTSIPAYERAGLRGFSTDRPTISAPLPTVSAEGEVKRGRKKFVVARKKEPESVPEPVNEAENLGTPDTKPSPPVPKRRKKDTKELGIPFAQVRAELAGTASKLLAAPEENIGLLGELRTFSARHRGRAAALSILTEAQVYKDLAPGYRIRSITEQEAAVTVSKDVAKLRTYEQALLAAYTRYVRSITSLTRTRVSGKDKQPLSKAADQARTVRQAACTASAELIKALPHFNEIDVLVNAVCALASDREETIRKEAASALRTVLGESHRASGPVLATCVNIAQTLSKAAMSKTGMVSAEVVEPFLGIKFASFPMLPIGKPRPKKGNFKGKNKKVNKRNAAREAKEESAKAQLERETETEVMRDLREAEGEPTPQELYRVRRALLDSVCQALFNVVHRAAASAEQAKADGESTRTRKPPPALAPALHGLHRVAEFISIDIVEAILAALAPLLDSERLPLLIRLRCLSASYAILAHHSRATGTSEDMVAADARALDRALYAATGTLLHGVSPGAEEAAAAELTRALAAATAFRELPVARAAALARRITTAALSAPSHAVALALVAAVQFIAPRCMVTCVFSRDAAANAVDGEHVAEADLVIDDPDAAAAQHSGIWELAALSSHFHPAVREAAREICKAGKEPTTIAGIAGAPALVKKFSADGGGFNPPPVAEWSGDKDRKERVLDEALLDVDNDVPECIPESFLIQAWQLVNSPS